MRNWLLWSCVALALPSHGWAQQAAVAGKPPAVDKPAVPVQSKDAAPQTKLAALLEAKVHDAWGAFKRKDKAAYAKFLTDDFQAVESDGEGERTRLHVLGEVEHCMYTDFLLQFFQVQPLGPDYAFVTYESSMQFPKSSALRFRRVFIGELWTRQGADWKMMRYQETLVR
jgi:hypothetical protein